VWLWWAYRTYDICTLLSIQYLGREGGGRDGRKQYLTIEVFQYMFLLYYFIKAMGWGGGSRSDYSRHLYILGCAGGGGAGLPVYSLY
jgi:hypothetical protein